MYTVRKITKTLYFFALVASIAYAAFIHLPFIGFPLMAAFFAWVFYSANRHVRRREAYPHWEHTDAMSLGIGLVIPLIIAAGLSLMIISSAVAASVFWSAASPFMVLVGVGILGIYLWPEDRSACYPCQHKVKVSETNVCPTCGREFNSQWSGLASHWKARHGEQVSYEDFKTGLCREHKAYFSGQTSH